MVGLQGDIIDQRNNIFKALVSEADEIKADRNIMAYEKQAKGKVSTKSYRRPSQ